MTGPLKSHVWTISLFAGVIVLSFLSMGVGALRISPGDVLQAILGSGDSSHRFIIEQYRLPRIVLACITGAGLAVSGAVLQSIIRNPLASPDVIGITKGAGLASAIVLVLFPKSPTAALPVAAFAGAGLVALALVLLVRKQGAKPIAIALVGIALGAICQAGIQYVMVKNPVHVNAALVWLTGSLWGKSWDQVIHLLPWFAVLFPLVIILSSKMNVLHLGDDVAEGLGENVKTSRYVLLALAVGLAGSCVAAVGSIGFVGLVAPHMARRIVGAKHEHVIPAAAALGAILILLADGLGRGLLPPLEIPAGIITAIIGAPYFLYLIRHESRRR